MAVLGLGSGATPLLFNENLRCEQRTHVVLAFIDHPNLDRLDAFVERRWVEIQAVPAGMKIRVAAVALFGNLDLIHQLYFRCAVIAPGNHMELGFDSSTRPFLARRRLRLFLPVRIHVTGLTIFSGHLAPCPGSCTAETRQ